MLNSKNKNLNKFFFLEKNLKNCSNFGILIYDFPFDKIKPQFGNIGDYIQSLAALQFLPKNCTPIFIERDTIELYNGKKVNLIMNGWYQITKGNRFVSSNIMPIYSSIHINNPNYIDSFFINNLKKYEPIGCRDIYTLNILKKYRIKSYFSSCLTTTLDIDYKINESERSNEIIFIEYNFGYDKQIDDYIKSLKAYNFNKIKFTNHFFNTKLSQIERFRLAKSLIDKYARAKLIITTRLHGALSCLALNTPFIFVNKEYDKRYYGLYELINHVGINSTGNFNINVLFNKNNLVINPKTYLNYSNKLKNKFINISKINH